MGSGCLDGPPASILNRGCQLVVSFWGGNRAGGGCREDMEWGAKSWGDIDRQGRQWAPAGPEVTRKDHRVCWNLGCGNDSWKSGCSCSIHPKKWRGKPSPQLPLTGSRHNPDLESPTPNNSSSYPKRPESLTPNDPSSYPK